MKNLKIALFSLAFIAIAAMGTAFKPTKPHKFTDAFYNFTGAAHSPAINFVVGTTSSTELTNTSNWASGDITCATPDNLLCKVKVTFTGTAPSESTVLTAVKTEYDRIAGLSQTFTDGYSWTANGRTYTISLKS